MAWMSKVLSLVGEISKSGFIGHHGVVDVVVFFLERSAVVETGVEGVLQAKCVADFVQQRVFLERRIPTETIMLIDVEVDVPRAIGIGADVIPLVLDLIRFREKTEPGRIFLAAPRELNVPSDSPWPQEI